MGTYAEAIARIQEDLGNRTGTVTLARIQARFPIALRELESGKTLPKFLLQEDVALVLPIGDSSVTLPTGYIRWHTAPHFTVAGEDVPTFLRPKPYEDAYFANLTTEASGPEVFAIRKTTIDFINTADTTYNMIWSYYKHSSPLTDPNGTNEWLSDEGAGQDWLIGEVGWRVAMSLRDKEGASLFDNLRKTARASVLGEIIVSEDNDGPLIMGVNL